MTYFKILSYIIVVLIILFTLFSSVYYIKPFKYITGCPVNKNISNGNKFKWILEDEIKKFTKLEDDYIKSKR